MTCIRSKCHYMPLKAENVLKTFYVIAIALYVSMGYSDWYPFFTLFMFVSRSFFYRCPFDKLIILIVSAIIILYEYIYTVLDNKIKTVYFFNMICIIDHNFVEFY